MTILAAVDRARLDLDAGADPAGTVRVGGFATGIRVSLLPIAAAFRQRLPQVDFIISEYEPVEAFRLLTADDLDLALTYDYNLAPASPELCWNQCRSGRSAGASGCRVAPRALDHAARLRRPHVDRELPQHR